MLLMYFKWFIGSTMLMFFMSTLPMGIVWTLLTTSVEYLLDWYVLIRRTNSKISYSTTIAKKFTRSYHFCMLMYALGCVAHELKIEYFNLQFMETLLNQFLISGNVN